MQKGQKNNLLCNSKEGSRRVNYGTGQYKGRRGLKGPRRPTEPSDLLDFEESVRLRQQLQLLPFDLHGPGPKSLAEGPLVVAG